PRGKNAATDIRLQQLKTWLASTRRTAAGATDETSPSDLIPVPLTASTWGQAVFHRRLTAADLFAAILSDRQAALLCSVLAGRDAAVSGRPPGAAQANLRAGSASFCRVRRLRAHSRRQSGPARGW